MALRFRLQPTNDQVFGLVERCKEARYAWNLGVEQYEFARKYRPYRLGKRQAWPNDKQRSAQLKEARDEFPWLRAGSVMVQQQALKDLDRAYQNWFKRPDHFRRPDYRNARDDNGFNITDLKPRVMNLVDNKTGTVNQKQRSGKVAQINHRWATIDVVGIGPVRFRLSRPWADVAECKSARVTLDASGRWHVSFVALQPAVKRESTGAVVGVDLGVTRSVATSDGEFLDMPELLSAGEEQRKRRLERKKARQLKGSKRIERTRRRLAVLAAREADRRKNWIEKTTTKLVRDHDLIVIEDLQVSNMTRSAKGTKANPGKRVTQKRGLNRSIQRQAWALWRMRLEAKAEASNVIVVAVSPKNTSRRCNACGHTSMLNRKNQAEFACTSCGHEMNADVNAAKNILERGLQIVAAGPAVSGRGRTPRSSGPDEASNNPGSLAA